MNSQREYIYRERADLLEGEDISENIRNYIRSTCEIGIEIYSDGKKHPEDWDLQALKQWLKSTFLVDIDYNELDPHKLSYRDFLSALQEKMLGEYRKKEQEVGTEPMRAVERMISLQVIDAKWREHLLAMDELRDGIWAVGYSERNPLVEYKLRAFEAFNGMLERMRQDIVEFLMKVQIREKIEEEVEFKKIGEEFRPEVGQFGEGGIPLSPPPAQLRQHDNTDMAPVTGGVKRKKTRRSRRN
jgi:preprotein translocase subunit SecA